jgi:hypothetical protein
MRDVKCGPDEAVTNSPALYQLTGGRVFVKFDAQVAGAARNLLGPNPSPGCP